MPSHKYIGSGAPATAPRKIGDHYTDTTGGVPYISVGTDSPSDWVNIGIGTVTGSGANVANIIIGPATHAEASLFNYTTDGTDDEVQFNDAFGDLPSGGGTVLIRDGTYTIGDLIEIPSNVTLILGPGAVITPEDNYAPTTQTLSGVTIRSMITNADHSGGNTNINIVGSGRITAEGVTIPTPNTVAGPSFAAVWFHKVTESTIEKCKIDNILWDISGGEITGVRQYGILFTESHRNKILYSQIEYVGNDCISLRRDSSDNLVLGVIGRYSLYGHSVGQDTSGSALFLGTAGSDIQNNKYIGCTAIGDPATASIACAGIVSHSGKNTLIADCISYTCGLGFALAGDAKGCVIRDCTVVDPVHYGVWARTDASGDNNDNSISGIKVRMASTTLYGVHVYSTASGDDTNRFSISDCQITGTGGASQKGFYLRGGGGSISDYNISNCFVTDCGAEGLLIDSTATTSSLGRITISNFKARSCLYGIRIGAITAAGTVTNGYIDDCWINSSVSSSIGISLEATSGWIINAGRIRVSGIAIQDDGSSSANRILFTDTTSSGTVAPQMAGTGSRAVGFDYGSTGGTGSLVFSNQPTFTGPVRIISITNGLNVGSDNGALSTTDTVTKSGTITCPHYTNSEEPISGVVMSSASSSTVIGVGGGTVDANAATEVRIYTAANNTTTTGTARLTVDSSGAVAIGGALSAGSLTLGTALAAAQGGTGLTALGTGVATFLSTPSSANLLAAITDETGTGNVVFNTAPNFTSGFTVGGLTSLASNGGIDIASGGIGLVVGADSAASTRTNTTTKVARIAQPHYTNSEEPLALLIGSSTSSASTVIIGGGSSTNNTATSVVLRTAANTTTTSGSDRLTVDSAGVFKLSNADSAPGSSPTGGGYLYTEAGALKYRGSSGTITTIANA